LTSSARSITDTSPDISEREEETMNANTIGFKAAGGTDEVVTHMSEDNNNNTFPKDPDPIYTRLKVYSKDLVKEGNTPAAFVCESIIELYISGMVEVTFDEQGSPIPEAVQRTVPLVTFPMFADPNKTFDSLTHKKELN
tara:strand:+ start:91 stop:507 length:417 start_codon:yes stop_codon:yes gene_type:complete